MGTRSGSKQHDAWQGLAALVGVTLGVVPLVLLGVGRGPGLWQRLSLTATGSGAVVAPLIAFVVAAAVIAGLEVAKRRN
ncbi:hypothetical protein AB1207_20765 [Kineococcus endophyticus]|uniref:Uncharacterized protein n=1 Tax=Kineococcus endophyticus TaxID=1181883 RepID=A0ABV3PDC2_9ACTN